MGLGQSLSKLNTCVILYKYGDDKSIVYFWQGSNTSVDEKGASAIHAMDNILMDRFPLIVRHIESKRLKKENNELPSSFIERVFSSSQQAQLNDAPMLAPVLVKIITLLGTNNFNKSVKDYLIKIMRESPNIDKKDDIMTFIYALETDKCAKQEQRGRRE